MNPLIPRNEGGGSDFPLFKMTDGIVTSVHTAASKDTDRPAESVTLSFGKVEFDYRPTNPDGSAGTVKSFKCDVALVKSF
jgi:type VI protein secretion system component Hcp